MIRRSPGRLALLVAVLLNGCSEGSPVRPPDPSPAAPEFLVVRGGTSFGFCPSYLYCSSQLEITQDQAVFTLTSRERGDLRRVRPVSEAEWRGLRAAVDEMRLRALPAVIGCPDCADGGRETIEVATASWKTQVAFEYGKTVPGIEELVQRVRTIREGFPPLF
jgi:hypothetical protein